MIISLALLWCSASFITVGEASGAAGVPGYSTLIDQTRMAPELVESVRQDLENIGRISIEAPAGGMFDQVFGGTSASLIPPYLNQRIHFIGTTKTDLRDKTTYALNLGPNFLVYYYQTQILHNPRARPTRASFENGFVYTNSPRTGFVSIGGAYVGAGTSIVDRLDTLVHEARHSDCPRIPDVEDLKMFNDEEAPLLSEEGQTCTHVHIPCPDGPLKGELACDGHPWGAYVMGYVFSATVASSCAGCSERVRQEGLAAAADDFSRLTKDVQDGLLNGTAPPPDMTGLPSSMNQ